LKEWTAGPSFTRKFFEKQAEYGLSDDGGAYVVSTLFEVGIETMAAGMMSFVMAKVRHPEWQKQLQEKLAIAGWLPLRHAESSHSQSGRQGGPPMAACLSWKGAASTY